MSRATPQEAALRQLATVPGVVGGLIFDAAGKVRDSAFSAAYDPWAMAQLAAQLAADGFFQDWMAGEQGLLALRFVDGQVFVRSLGGAYALVLAEAQANEQLLSMSLAQLARRLRPAPAPQGRPPPPPARRGSWPGAPPVLSRTPVPARPGPPGAPAAAPPAPVPGPIFRLEELAREELGDQAAPALRILAAAGPRARDQLRAISEVERLVRLFLNAEKADELARRMRAVLGQ